MQVSFIIINWNTFELASQAIDSIRKHEQGRDYEIVVVDNGSSDGSAEIIREKHPDVVLIANDRNVGFAQANNQGAAVARGEWLILFNSDAYLTEPLIGALLRAAESVGKPCILTCRLLYADGTPQLSAMPFPSLGGYLLEVLGDTRTAHRRMHQAIERFPGDIAPADWVSGAIMAVPREVYAELGGLEASIFMYGEDVDFCRKASAKGIRCFVTKIVSAVHIGGASLDKLSVRALSLTDQGRLAYFRRWHGRRKAFALRCIFLLRSVLRVLYFSATGLLKRDHVRLSKAIMHMRAAAFLAGAR